MNNSYRLIWNTLRHCWIVVAETVKSKSGKSKSGKSKSSTSKSNQSKSLLVSSAVVASLSVSSVAAEVANNALPTGAQVVNGQVSFSQNGSHLGITQTTNRAIINWQTFNIGRQAEVEFYQPGSSAIALNRVLSSDPTSIFGKLTSNGQVWLINPNGVLFGAGSRVDVGGLVASTLNISDSDFLTGNYHFTGGNIAGGIANYGNISVANQSYVALLAPEILNDGVIVAQQGTVVATAGDKVSLDFGGHQLVGVAVEAADISTHIENKHLIKADGGQILMSAKTADKLMTSVINNSGNIEANALVNDGGVIRLASTGRVTNSGTLSAKSESGKGGKVELLGDQVGVFGAGVIDTSGKTGGGTILVGGDYQGKNTAVQNAQRTFISQDAQLIADATESGDGGKVIVWADETTRYYGSISAKGGSLTGDGGFVEVSGKQTLDFIGAVDVSAANGVGGNVLLDPQDIILNNSTQASPPNNANGTPDIAFAAPPDPGTTTIQIADITGYSELFLQATRDITINNAITMAANNSIRLEANNNINVNAAVTVSGLNGNISFTTDADNSGVGNLAIGGNLTSQFGSIYLNGATVSRTAGNIVATGGADSSGGIVSILASGAVNLGAATITANGGAPTAGIGGRPGGIINISGASVTGTGAITANGSNANGANLGGGSAGTVIINSTGDVSLGAINVRTGNATGTGASGAVGSVSVAGGNVTVGAINTSGQNNGNGGSISVNATGTLNLNGAINSSGGTAITGNSGKNAGAINLSAGSTITSAVAATITANGGNGVGTSQSGGNGATVTISAGGDTSLRAINANGANATATNAKGGNAGSILLSTTAGNLTTNAALLSARAGTGTGTGVDSTQGAITVSNTSASGTILIGNLTTAGNANGHGGNISVTGNGDVTLGTVATSGGGSTGTRVGRNAGNVTIAGAAVSVGTITASGGTGVGANQAGGNAGVVGVTGTGALNTTAITVSTGAATGTGTGGAVGSISLSGSTVTTTALTATGGANGDGGNISVTSTVGNMMLGAVAASGGTAVAGNAGRHAGAVTVNSAGAINATSFTANGSAANGATLNLAGGNAAAINITGVGGVTTTTVGASGGAASTTNANGGNAGAINISNSGSGNIATTGLTSQGGAGTGTGNGGTEGGVTLLNTAIAGNVTTTGNIATNGNANVNGGAVSISSVGNASVTGTINASGGTSTGTRAGRNAGNVTITGIDRAVGGAITASGGAGIGTNQAGGNAAVVSITGTGTLSTAGITARTGNATGSGTGGTAGSITLSGDSVAAGALSTQRGTNGAGGVVNVTTTGAATSSVASINADNNAAVNMNVADTLSVAGVIQGAGVSVNKSGTGTLILSGANTYTGATNINTGTLIAASNNALGGTGTGTTVANGATLGVQGGVTVGEAVVLNGTGVSSGGALRNLSGNNTLSGTITQASASRINSDANTLTLSGTNFTGAFGLTVGGDGNITSSKVIATGANTLTKDGAGTLTLSAANTYTGTTTISAGTLQVGNAGTAGSLGTGSVTNNAALIFNRTNALAVTNVISGTGTLTQAGTGTTTISGNNTYSGNTIISAGTLQVAGGNGIGDSSFVEIDAGGTLNLNGTNETIGSLSGLGSVTLGTGTLTAGGNNTSTIYTGIISGTGGLTKTGTGVLFLFGNNSYSGVTNINAGNLGVGSVSALGTTAGGTAVASGATLDIIGVAIGAEAVTLNGNGSAGSAGALVGIDAASLAGNVTLASSSRIGTGTAASSFNLTGTVSAPFLLSLAGEGDITATNATNNFSTVNINGANDVSLRDTNAITLGGGVSNLTGNLTVQAAGNVTVASNIATTGGDITLAGTNFINTAGTSALSASGRWLVYANTHTGNTFGGLDSSNQAVWGVAYPTAVSPTGNRYVFANSPTVTVTSNNQSKTYGQDGAPIVANAFSATGFVDAIAFGNVFTQDTVANALTGNATSLGSPTNANVGSYAIDVTPITATTGYSLSKNSTGLLTVDAANLTITADNQSKVYGNTFSFLGSEFTSMGLQNGETIGSVTLTSAGAPDNANVGAYDILASSATGGSFSASNYNITYVDGTMTVDPATISLSGTRTYNGTTAFNPADFGTVNGVLGQTLNLSGVGSVASANAGAAQTLTLGSLALTNGTGLSSNYTLTGGTHTGSINQANLTISTSNVTKTYDGSLVAVGTAAVTSGMLFTNVSNGNTLDTISGGTFAFTNANAGVGNKTVTTTGVTVNDGNSGGNYNVMYADNTTSTINKANLTISTTDVVKTYDGTTAAVGTAVVTSGTLYNNASNGNALDNLSGGSFQFTNKNAGTGNKTVTVTGVTINDGNAGGNYEVIYADNTTSTINKAALTLNAVTDTKTYDGNTNSAGVVSIVGLQTGDNVTASQSFDSQNAGARTLAVNVGYVVNDGNSGGNYDVSTNTAAGTIDPKALTVTANNQIKTYGQTVNLTGTEFTSSGLVAGESIDSATINSLGALSTANVAGGPYVISITNATGGTFDPNNYTISYVDGQLTVNPALLTISANNATRVLGAANPLFSGVITGFVNGETIAVLNGTLGYSTSATNVSPVGNYGITPFGVSADNYIISFVDGVLTVTGQSSIPDGVIPLPHQTSQNCSNTTNVAQGWMIEGIDSASNSGISDVEYQKPVQQIQSGGSVANALASGQCASL